MPTELIQFGEFELDRGGFELRRGGSVVRLERIPLELLLFLTERRGQLVTREEILEHIWGKDVFVDSDNSINTAVRKVRLALREDPENPRFLRTVPGKGYRFVAEPAREAAAAGVPAPTTVITAGPPGEEATAPGKSRRRLVAAVVGVVLVAAGIAGVTRFFHTPSGPGQRRITLVVLPFVNLSGDPQQEYFTDGITEEVITQLGGLDPEQLGVIARTSSMQYKGTNKDVGAIAREVGADYLLEGSIRRDGDRVRLTGQLIQARDQMHVWAGDFDGKQSEVLKLQSDLALAISSKIALTLSPQAAARLVAPPVVNAEAYQAYLAGLQAFGMRTKEATLRSVAEYQRSIELDRDYAPPYAGLATMYALASVFGAMSSQEGMPKAKEAALRAIALDDSLASGHTALAFVLAHFEFNWVDAEREFRRGIELNANDADARFFFSNSFLSPMGRHEEAIAEMKRALELDPRSPSIQSFFGQTLVWAGKPDEAMTQYKKCAEMFPRFAINHERIAHLHAYMGRYEEAIAEDTRARILTGEDPETAMKRDADFRKKLAVDGAKGYWMKLMESAKLPGNPPEAYVTPQHMAIMAAAMGEREKALALLEQAYGVRGMGLTELAMEPAFVPLRGEARFQSLLQKTGLAGVNK